MNILKQKKGDKYMIQFRKQRKKPSQKKKETKKIKRSQQVAPDFVSTNRKAAQDLT
jgi:hypothetical protein